MTVALVSIVVSITPKDVWENIGQTFSNISNKLVETGNDIVTNIKRNVTTINKTTIQKSTTNKIITKISSTNKSIPKKQQIFPVDPYDFKPKGLQMIEYPGSKNGKIIQWTNFSGAKVFSWHEDILHSSHYHVYEMGSKKHNGIHYMPLTPVPEPWKTLYFGGKL